MGPSPIQYAFRSTLLHTTCTLHYTLAHAAWADPFADF